MNFRKLALATAAAVILTAAAGCDAAVEPEAETVTPEPSIVVSASPVPAETAETTESPVAATSEPVLSDATVAVLGEITELDLEADMVTISEGLDPEVEDATDSTYSFDPTTAYTAILNDNTILIDAVSGDAVSREDLQAELRVYAFISANMTRSLPPQAQCYALIVNIPDNGLGIASYVKALDVMTAENGDLVILNQNADLYVTIPADLSIGTLGTDETTPADAIAVGSVMIAWYDAVAESYPAQTTATKVIYCPPDTEARMLAAESAAPSAKSSKDASEAATSRPTGDSSEVSAEATNSTEPAEDTEEPTSGEDLAVGDY